MLPDPLHPAVIHFPIVLMVLLPLVAAWALWTIRRGARPAAAWLVPLVTAAALALSSWIAVETGEREEDRVERVVPEASMHGHEEAAERFHDLLSRVVLGKGSRTRRAHGDTETRREQRGSSSRFGIAPSFSSA